ncbi:MAG: hypothetical protein ACFCGT_17285 [Sandaracinaceae bacterium]
MAADPPAGGPPPVLGWGALALLAVGAALLARDVLDHTVRPGGWWALGAGGLGLVAAGWWRALAGGPRLSSAPRLALVAAGRWLLLQAALPLRYYLGDDPYDERFAWRMFSTVRLARCELRVIERREGRWRRTPLGRTLHVAWIGLLERNRPAVWSAYLRSRCEEGADAVRLENRCVGPAGAPLPVARRRVDCRRGEVVEPAR